ncbi:MAG: hypothetical protein U1E52_09310 [Geminicoccaceae bacterium]
MPTMSAPAMGRRHCRSRCSGSVPGASPPPPVTPVGQHVAFAASDRAAVDGVLAAAALAAGGSDTLPAGAAPALSSSFITFVLDPDGHRLEAVCHHPE